MTYREKLEKYKNKLLSEEEMKEVKDEIEKMDAISEYLSEKLEEELDFCSSSADGEVDGDLGGAEDCTDEYGAKITRDFRRSSGSSQSILDKNADNFEKYVKKSIRRAYLKISAGIGAVLLAVLLFIQFGLSPLMDALYYDPTEQIEIPVEDGNAAVVYHKMTMDYRIYAELTLPCRNEANVVAYPQGFGNYTLSILPVVSYGTKDAKSAAGQIRKGKLELYDPEYLEGVSPNYFVSYGLDPDSEKDYEEQMEEYANKTFKDQDSIEYRSQLWFYDSLESAGKAVEELEENRYYLAYVSLRKDLDFTETNRMMEEILGNPVKVIEQPWMAVRNDETGTSPNGVLGYNYENIIVKSAPSSYNEEYPYLTFFDAEEEYDYERAEEMCKDEEIMTRHIISMCEYLGDREEFVSMMDQDRAGSKGRFRGYARYIEEHGLKCYGFVCITTRADMEKMLEHEQIISIIPRDWQ